MILICSGNLIILQNNNSAPLLGLSRNVKNIWIKDTLKQSFCNYSTKTKELSNIIQDCRLAQLWDEPKKKKKNKQLNENRSAVGEIIRKWRKYILQLLAIKQTNRGNNFEFYPKTSNPLWCMGVGTSYFEAAFLQRGTTDLY